ncbi:NFACT RNA binding domain-containing protein [Nitratiruptor tergarcus]|uniref:Predicted RNA-binding protein homologous to eukaryotic snRNP n=1 Tax=Nitratiruptor tergarcus DSM 16512 TaxID=1069081 RepID=A0A1W1WS41_9BACT|nr:NFACT RNA binding domain-containing protein [Nitratiruptor tergarcus]SMC08523.1 Predicted RNA-binding protein homologous to eukaryotic snRNP [Nitratiruptor tergarcus DSM 16512]
MKYKELRAIVEYLQQFRHLNDIARVDDNVLRAVFDKKEIFFDLNRSKNLIYMRDDFVKTKFYNAPFDKVLAKRCKKSSIEKIELDNDDKIIRIYCKKRGSYKEESAILQLEFTGRHANVIILDEKGHVLEALHHDFHRDIRPGKPLYPLTPPKKLDKSEFNIFDIEEYLYNIYNQELEKRLNILKSAKLLQINKQKDKLQKLLDSLEREEELLAQADAEEQKGQIVLANLHQIKPYQEEFEGEDFEGNPIKFTLPAEAKTPAMMSDIFFKRAKKLRQKAANIHIQRENLQEKIAFLDKKANLVRNAKRVEDIELLFSKSAKKEAKKDKNYERYNIAGYDVYIGKNKRGNVELLKKAKASDIWLHLKDLPSAHVIIATNKQNVPQDVLEQAAKLCASFSVEHPGSYKVDYTQRRNVKPKEGANVEYVKYKTLSVRI